MEHSDLGVNFMTWQCRLRQIAMREDGGRPSGGMTPRVLDMDGNELADSIVVVLVRENPLESTEFLKFQVQKHNAPEDIYKKSLTYLQSSHYHQSAEFADEMTAQFASTSPFAEDLIERGEVQLEFEQFSQRYLIPCRVHRLLPEEPAFQATLWHNRVFNPSLGDDVTIIGFQPDWATASFMKAAG